MVPHAITLYDIRHTLNLSLQNYILSRMRYKTTCDIRRRFIRSCAASCILCYVLGVGDRHLENIMVTDTGHLMHIDFTYLIGADPHRSMACDMRVTPDMIDMFGGTESEEYITFRNLCSEAYMVVRRYASLWYMLLLPLSDPEKVQQHIIHRLVPGELDHAASLHIVDVVDKSSESETWSTKLYDWSHYMHNVMFPMD